MYNSFKLSNVQISLLFSDESFTKREAWGWLVANSTNGKISCSIRYLALCWKWHRSKVERFLQRIKFESLIETEIESGKLVISISNYEHFGVSTQTIETPSKTISSQNQDSGANKNQFQDSNRDTETLENPKLTANIETIPSQNQDSLLRQEEKKKRSKKRKEEELLKEKNIPYGDTKKEKAVPFQLVQESDVATWVEETLQMQINLSWELGKFRDYWLSTRNKPPKDGIAAFRNWLRKSLEINDKYGGKIERFNKKPRQATSEQSTGFERFLAGGARALAKVSEH